MVIINQGIQRSEASYRHIENEKMCIKGGFMRRKRSEASLNTLVPLIYLNKICINILFKKYICSLLVFLIMV